MSEATIEEVPKDLPLVEVRVKDDRWKYPVMCGYMTKRSGGMKNKIRNWRKRYFILTHDGRLWYFKNDKAKNPQNKQAVFIKDMKFWKSEKKANAIKIEKYPFPFYFHGKDFNDRIRWMEKLSLVGGIKCEKEKDLKKKEEYEKNVPEIAKKDLKNWTNKMVKEWLGYHCLGKEHTFLSAYEDKFESVTGKELDIFEEKDLIKLGIQKIAHRKKMIRAIRELRERRVFNYTEHLVFTKIESMCRNMGSKTKGSNWKFLARSLSDPECMRKTYLSTSVLEEDLNRYIGSEVNGTNEHNKEEEEGEHNTNSAESQPQPQELNEKESTNNDGLDDGVDVLADDDENTSDEEDEKGGEKSLDVRKKQVESVNLKNVKPEKFKLPVKLVVTEMVRNSNYKTARKLLSPVISQIPQFSKEFGIFHTAIIVGPWYLEWTDSSLCIPRKLYSGMALISADMDSSSVLSNTTIDDITIRLAKVICKWNCTKSYCNINMSKKVDQGNCQEFVEDLMETLNVTINREGAFGQFLERMKKNGKCEMEFSPTKTFKENFQLSLDNYHFDSHTELDDFVTKCNQVDGIGFQIDFKEEGRLLKSFDRAFWLRHFKNLKEEIFKPSPNGCPFDDPRKTKSYMVYS